MAGEHLVDMSEFILSTDLNSPGNFLFQENKLEDVITDGNEDLSMLLDLESFEKKVDSPQQTIPESLDDVNVISSYENMTHDSTAFHATDEFSFLQQPEHLGETQTVVEPQLDTTLANPIWGNSFVQKFEQLSVTPTPQVQVAGAEHPVSRGRKRPNQQEIHEIMDEIKQLETMEKSRSPEADRETIRHKVKRKKNTVACRKSRQKKKEYEEAKTKKIEDLEQKLKQVEDESSKKLENMKKQFGMIVNAMLNASMQHVSPQAQHYIFTEWSKMN